MIKICFLFATALLVSFSADSCSAADPLHQLAPQDLEYLNGAKSITVYGIVPNKKATKPNILGTYPIVATAVLASPAVRNIMIEGLRQSIEYGTSMAACFNPHHAIAVAGNDGTLRTFIVCFECGEIREFRDSNVKEKYASYAVASHFQALFDSILAANDFSYMGRTRYKGIAPLNYIKEGEEITTLNSLQAARWKDELSGDEISSLDYTRHPKAKKLLTGGSLLRPGDFKYANEGNTSK